MGRNVPLPPAERQIDGNSKFDWPIIGIILFYAALLLIFKPWTLDFPLNDDWAYALGVRHFLEDARLKLCDWTAVTQVAHILWGAAWVKILGGSFGTLKLSTLVAAAVGTSAFYLSLKELGIAPNLRLLAALALAANPIYFCLSFSFMTEIPYSALALISFYFFIKSEKAGRSAANAPLSRWDRTDTFIISGSLAAAAAALMRQTGVLIPAGYFIHLSLQKKLNPKKFVLLWAIPAFAVFGYSLWFHFIHGPTWASQYMQGTAVARFLSHPDSAMGDLLARFFASLLLLGFFTFPISIGFLIFPGQFFAKKSPVQTPSYLAIPIIAYIFGIMIFLAMKGWMPHLENTLAHSGLGTVTVAGAAVKASGIFGWQGFWIWVTLLSFLSSLIFIAALFNGDFPASAVSAFYIYLLPPLLEIALLMFRDRFFDRYALSPTPAALLILSVCAQRWKFSFKTATLGLAMLFLFSFAGTQDYLSWNNAKWKVGRMGLEKGLKPEQIANGFDWDALWTYEKNMQALRNIKPLSQIGEWDWQKMNPYAALTSFRSQNPPLQVLAQAPYRTWLSSQTQYIYLWVSENPGPKTGY